jgi:hypothetical protein
MAELAGVEAAALDPLPELAPRAVHIAADLQHAAERDDSEVDLLDGLVVAIEQPIAATKRCAPASLQCSSDPRILHRHHASA